MSGVGTNLCLLCTGQGSLYSKPPCLSSPALPCASHCSPSRPPPLPAPAKGMKKDIALDRVWGLGVNSVTCLTLWPSPL